MSSDSFTYAASASGLYEEEERDGWAIAPELEKNPKSVDHSGKQWTCLPAELFSNFALTVLNLSNNSLIYIPEDIAQLSVLEELYLSHNRLGRGPQLDFPLPNLTVLRLAHNQLKELPHNIGMLSNLRVLDVSHNNITELSASMEHLSSLEILRLEHNQLLRLRPELYHLTKLKELHAFNNKLTTLETITFPSQIEIIDLTNNGLSFVHPLQFSVVEKLVFLGLSNNRICFIDEEMFYNQMHSLEEFHLASNHLQQIPCSIGALLNLKLLNLAGNRLAELPVSIGHLRSLQSLHLNSNYLYELPRSIGNLNNLSLLDLSYNQIVTLPPTIGRLSKLQQIKLMYNLRLQHLPTLLLDLHKLILLDVTGCENLVSPPLDICQQGIKETMDYLKTVPLSVTDMQEGWELIDPTPDDIKKEYGLSSTDVAPHLLNESNDYDMGYTNTNEEEEVEEQVEGWLSYTKSLLYRSIWAVLLLLFSCICSLF